MLRVYAAYHGDQMTREMTRLGLGLAALGRPGYITLDHARDLGATDERAMERHCHGVLDAAWAAGVRWFDAARSYGRAEAFLASWLAREARPGVTVSSKWGYRYTADWQVAAAQHEVKDHSLAALDRQLAESRALLGTRLAVYQVHSLTPDSPLLDDRAALARLGELRDAGLAVGLTLSGPRQRETLERALAVRVGGAPLWSHVQATWNLLERSVAPALQAAHDQGVRVIVKEALANGKLAKAAPEPLQRLSAELSAMPDAVAIAIAMAQPFVDVVLSGAATAQQVVENARALALTPHDDLAELVMPPEQYWSERARLAWN